MNCTCTISLGPINSKIDETYLEEIEKEDDEFFAQAKPKKSVEERETGAQTILMISLI